MAVLVTGGAGFIGSHACAELLEHGHETVVIDDFSNSYPAAIAAVERLAGTKLPVYAVDVRDRAGLDEVFASHQISAVIHFAAKKAVGESAAKPLEYFDVNVAGTISLLRAMREHGVSKLVFSSSCSVYGDQYRRPITEDDEPAPASPYARSKLICEQILESACASHQDLRVLSLRYFNPAGAHPSGLIGECPRGVPSNVVPFMVGVAAGTLDKLAVFGGDYETPDGTAIRDYIHVADLAQAHRIALDHLDDEPGMRALNLGTGAGASVLELISTFERTCGVRVPHVVTGRRPGDVPSLVADASRVARAWGWRPSRDLAAIFADSWRFQERNPRGFSAQAGAPQAGAPGP